MKYLVLLLVGILAFSLSSFKNSTFEHTVLFNSPPDSLVNNSLNLKDVSNKYVPKQLNLTNSIIENTEFNKFLSSTDRQTLASNPDFDVFITTIILKQYQFQLLKYHQGFDLYSMKLGNAGFIVNSFVELCRLSPEIKGLNSSYVMDFIAGNEKLKVDPTIVEIVNAINAIPK